MDGRKEGKKARRTGRKKYKRKERGKKMERVAAGLGSKDGVKDRLFPCTMAFFQSCY